jgi:hypothetical protein
VIGKIEKFLSGFWNFELFCIHLFNQKKDNE